jgi:hypothetical protein
MALFTISPIVVRTAICPMEPSLAAILGSISAPLGTIVFCSDAPASGAIGAPLLTRE